MRVLPHHDGLVNLRSFDERTGSPGGMQEARYESGLDNSPMYDCGSADQGDGCEYWNKTTGSMELLDVGMSSMAAQEAYALATLVRPNGEGEAGDGRKIRVERFVPVCTCANITLRHLFHHSLTHSHSLPATQADVINRTDTAASLRSRGDAYGAAIRAHLWNEEEGIYANYFPGNGSLSNRISPTSFYPMMLPPLSKGGDTPRSKSMGGAVGDAGDANGAGADGAVDGAVDRAVDGVDGARAEAMMARWLTNKTRFCVSDTFDTTNDPSCYWGLPSIAADDPAFPPLGYWRGFVWGA